MKNLSRVLILGAVLALPFGVSASNTEEVLKKENVKLIKIELDEDGCYMKVKGTTATGEKFVIKGSCDEVLATLEKL